MSRLRQTPISCYPCMRHYHMQKKLVGLTDEEVDAIEAIVMAVSAGRVMMQHAEAKDAKRSSIEDCEC